MNTRYIKLYLLIQVCLSAFLFSSCEKEDRTYQGPLYYEYSASECGQSNISNIFVKETKNDGADQICVQLMSPTSEEVRVNFRVADQLFYINNSAEYVTELPQGITSNQYVSYISTAQYGIDYKFGESNGLIYDTKYKTGSIVIPKGEMFGYIPLNILARKGNSTYIVLEDSQDAKANRPTSILNLQLSAEKVNYFTESLKEGIPSTWSTLDKDGDGLGWYYYESWGIVISDSYDYDTESAVNPENYLITPAITIPVNATNPVLSYEVAASATNDYKEKYKIVASEEPITLANCANATVLLDYTELSAEYNKKTFHTEFVDISSLKGKTVYIGFVHGDCSDQESILLRNVVVYGY